MCLGSQRTPCLKAPYSDPPGHLEYPILRPLSGTLVRLPRGIWPLVLCLVTMGPDSANSEANRDGARSWLPSLASSITHCSVSAEKLASRALSPTAQESPPPAWKASVPASPAHQAQRPRCPLTGLAPGILTCSLVALSGFVEAF